MGMRTLTLTLAFLLTTALSSAANFGSGQTTCPTSGTKRAIIPASSAVSSVAVIVIQAALSNAGQVAVGTTGVTTTTGPLLNPGDSFTMPPLANTSAYNTAQVSIACTNSADVITYTYLQ